MSVRSPDGLGRDLAVLDRGERPRRDEDLVGLRLAAQPRGEDDRVAHAAVVVAALEPDPAHRRVAGRDPDSDLQDVAAPAPLARELHEPLAHRDRHAHRARGVIRLEHRVVEEGHEPVAREMLERAFVLHDERAHRGVVRAQEPEHLFGLGRLGERREVAQVAEHRGDLAAMARQQRSPSGDRHERRDLGRQEPDSWPRWRSIVSSSRALPMPMAACSAKPLASAATALETAYLVAGQGEHADDVAVLLDRDADIVR